MVIIKKFDIEIKLQKVKISLYTNNRSPYLSYNDIFDYSDFIKLNSVIRLIAGQKLPKTIKYADCC